MITYNCPACRECLQVADEKAASAYVCTLCGTSTLVPGVAPAEKEAAAKAADGNALIGVAVAAVVGLWVVVSLIGALLSCGPLVTIFALGWLKVLVDEHPGLAVAAVCSPLAALLVVVAALAAWRCRQRG